MVDFINTKDLRLELQLSLTDTSTLWSVDTVYRKYLTDSRGIDCLIKLVNTLVDPRTETRCLFQTNSLIDEKQKIPASYSTLKSAGLIRPETHTTAKDYEILLTQEILDEMLDIMTKWVSANARYANEFKNLHRNHLVKDIVRYKEISEDGRDDAIPRFIYEFCRLQGAEKVQKIETILANKGIYWRKLDIMFVFAIITRAMQYECAMHFAYSGKASYITHPVRLLPACNDFFMTNDPEGISMQMDVGRKIISAWIETKSDFNVLAEWINKVKEKSRQHVPFFEGQITEKNEVDDILWDILSDVPPKIQERVIKQLTDTRDTIIAKGVGSLLGNRVGSIMGRGIGHWVGSAINTKIEHLVNFRIPPKITRFSLIRKIAYYPVYHNNSIYAHAKCPRCGTENLLPKCPVCGSDKKEFYTKYA